MPVETLLQLHVASLYQELSLLEAATIADSLDVGRCETSNKKGLLCAHPALSRRIAHPHGSDTARVPCLFAVSSPP